MCAKYAESIEPAAGLVEAFGDEVSGEFAEKFGFYFGIA
jgi:hypothetical protein